MVVLFLLLMLVVSTGVAVGEEQAVEQQIADAVAPLPASLQAGASVVLESEPGKRTVLRQGTNSIICQADTPGPGFSVACHHKAIDTFMTRVTELTASGKSGEAIRDAVIAEVKSGKIQVDAGRVTYFLTGPYREAALSIMAVTLPNATIESTGLSTELNHYRPWLMWGGTPVAHIMLPGQ